MKMCVFAVPSSLWFDHTTVIVRLSQFCSVIDGGRITARAWESAGVPLRPPSRGTRACPCGSVFVAGPSIPSCSDLCHNRGVCAYACACSAPGLTVWRRGKRVVPCAVGLWATPWVPVSRWLQPGARVASVSAGVESTCDCCRSVCRTYGLVALPDCLARPWRSCR